MTIATKKIIDALIQHKNVLLYGPPGTGKSHLMKDVANSFEGTSTSTKAETIVIDTCEERKPFSIDETAGISTRWVTFHQGYSYEDFILGMRPINSKSLGFTISPRPGVLLELVAEAQKGNKGLLLIDEINRGNTSRIFGEFITLMEPDKRLNEDGSESNTTVTLTLPYLAPGEVVKIETKAGEIDIKREFTMPANVYTLASMNSVDKSISPIDTALRRRFHIINLHPTKTSILSAVGLAENTQLTLEPSSKVDLDCKDIAIIGASLLIKLNRGIGLYLGNDFALGQWYLGNLANLSEKTDACNSLVESWLYKILPQLLELFHGREEQIIAMLERENIGMPGSGLSLIEPDTSESEYGATSYLEIVSIMPESSLVIEFLRKLTQLTS